VEQGKFEDTTREAVLFIELVELVKMVTNKLTVFMIGDMTSEEMIVIKLVEWAGTAINKVVYTTV
jgi:hypothetical protein